MKTAFIQANTQGHLHPADEPSIAPLDRGFLYGDAIYEVWRTYHGVIFAWEEHWIRLERSAACLHMTLPFGRAEILAEIKRTVVAFREREPSVPEVYIRLQVTRGAGAIGLDTALSDGVGYVVLVQENKLFTPEKIAAGLRLSIAQSLRRNPSEALNPAWKTGNYLNNILCLREARSRGADEVVVLNLAGEITEAAVSNIAFVRGDAVVTPPLSAGILGGITRDLLLREVAASAGITMCEESILPEVLGDFDECLLLSTTKDLTPVSSIDDLVFRHGVGSVTFRLKEAFTRYAQSYAQAHPELRA